VAAFAGRREARDDHVGLKAADVPDDVGQDGVVSPDLQRLVRTLREAEIERAREELFAAVDAARVEQLLRAEDAEELAFFVADEVLSAVAARHRQVGGAQQALVREVGDQRGVVVVGMRGDVHCASEDRQFPELELEFCSVSREQGRTAQDYEPLQN